MAVTLTYQQRVREAVADPAWQSFRVGLKGLPTRKKVRLLYAWLDSHTTDKAVLQVENYLKALARGGQVKIWYKLADGSVDIVEILR